MVGPFLKCTISSLSRSSIAASSYRYRTSLVSQTLLSRKPQTCRNNRVGNGLRHQMNVIRDCDVNDFPGSRTYSLPMGCSSTAALGVPSWAASRLGYDSSDRARQSRCCGNNCSIILGRGLDQLGPVWSGAHFQLVDSQWHAEQQAIKHHTFRRNPDSTQNLLKGWPQTWASKVANSIP